MSVNLFCSDFVSSSFNNFCLSNLARSFSICSASNWFLLAFNSASAFFCEFVISKISFCKAAWLTNCSDLKPATFASIAISSVFKSKSSFVNSLLSPSNLTCSFKALIRASIAFFSSLACLFKTLSNSSFAFILSSTVFLSSSLICLCVSASKSYCSIIFDFVILINHNSFYFEQLFLLGFKQI